MHAPLLLVLSDGHGDVWAGPLGALEVPFEVVSGNQALQAVRQGTARWVASERVPGWPALVRGAHAAGGFAILLGAPPSEGERARVDHLDLPSARDPEALRALLTARAALSGEKPGSPRADASSAEQRARFADSVASQADLAGVGLEACARVRDAVEAEHVFLYLVDPKGELEPEPRQGAADLDHRQLAQEIARSAQPWRGTHQGPCAGVPLLRGGDLLGVLLAARPPQHPPFEEADLDFLRHIAPPLAAAVQTALAHAGLKEARAQLLAGDRDLERRVEERTGLVVRAKREWEQTFDAIQEPIAVQDGLVIRRANLAYAARAGVPVQQLPGKICHQLLAGRDTPCPGCPLVAGNPNPGDVSLRDSRFVVSRFTHSGDAGEWAVMHYRDVTQQRRLEARLRESERMASLGQLASGAAHEINNPLGFVISNLNSLKRDVTELVGTLERLQGMAAREPGEALQALAGASWSFDPTDLTKMIDESLEGSARVAAIVKGLRDLSRLEIDAAGAASTSDSVSRAVRAELGNLPSAVVSGLAGTAPARIGPLQLDQVLGHLLRNARQALAPGGRVRIQTWDEPTHVVIEITDEGSGIPERDLPRIFEPFFTTRGVGQGIGLGLTSAYGIVQRHGGTLEVGSQMGVGSTFTLRLPRADLPGPLDG